MIRAFIFLSIFGALNIYVDLRFIGRWPFQHTSPKLFWLCAVLFFLLQLIGPLGDHIIPASFRTVPVLGPCLTALDWLSYITFGFFSCLFMYTVWGEVVSIASWLAWPSMDNTSFERRRFLTLGAATLATTAIGVIQATSKPQIERVDIHLDHLPDAFDGFSIAQVSDLHVSPLIGHDYVNQVVELTNSLKPDLIALTGDFVDGSIEQLEHKISPLANLTAPHGVFFVTGNHEYYWGAEPWIKRFEELGATVLSNEFRLIERDHSSFVLAGVPDYSTLHHESVNAFNPKKALEGAPLDNVKILLAHQPVSYQEASAAGFDLQLSGHTHAGQYFPFSLFIGFFQRYYQGLHRHDNMWIYVNRGTGYWGPPLRTGNPSEITLLTLRKTPNLNPTKES